MATARRANLDALTRSSKNRGRLAIASTAARLVPPSLAEGHTVLHTSAIRLTGRPSLREAAFLPSVCHTGPAGGVMARMRLRSAINSARLGFASSVKGSRSAVRKFALRPRPRLQPIENPIVHVSNYHLSHTHAPAAVFAP
jgi:hypothetical protein